VITFWPNESERKRWGCGGYLSEDAWPPKSFCELGNTTYWKIRIPLTEKKRKRDSKKQARIHSIQEKRGGSASHKALAPELWVEKRKKRISKFKKAKLIPRARITVGTLKKTTTNSKKSRG